MPTGFAKNTAADLPCRLFGTIELENAEMSEISGLQACLSWTTTLRLPAAVTVEIALSRKLSGPLLLCARFSE